MVKFSRAKNSRPNTTVRKYDEDYQREAIKKINGGQSIARVSLDIEECYGNPLSFPGERNDVYSLSVRAPALTGQTPLFRAAGFYPSPARGALTPFRPDVVVKIFLAVVIRDFFAGFDGAQ